ncbi:MAG: methionyl-tRNA formyltransferase [Anaerolineae bacterium]
MMTARIVFMGTPQFAVPALNRLQQTYRVVAVVTQPDRRGGRGRKPVAPAIKQAAQAANLPVLQPPSLKDPATVAQLRAFEPDVIVVAAFGQILRAEILALPPLGCINLHASLLPRWRGAAPVAAAIRAGDAQTGVTLMHMDEGLDTGPLIRARAIPIAPHHTRGSLTDELSRLGATLLIETLPGWLAQSITPRPQDNSRATLAPRLKKEAGLINWQQSALEIERHTRAFYPWPGTFSHWQGKRLKIHPVSAAPDWSGNLLPGAVFKLQNQIAVATGRGAVILQHIQLAGKQATPAVEFARGASHFLNAHL